MRTPSSGNDRFGEHQPIPDCRYGPLGFGRGRIHRNRRPESVTGVTFGPAGTSVTEINYSVLYPAPRQTA